MDRLTGQAKLCEARAALALALANHRHCDDAKRNHYRAIASHWFALARSYRLAEDISGFLDWDSQRMDPPEAFDALHAGFPRGHAARRVG